MCDLLCALPPATGGPTLFAKNSDRPLLERQIVEWSPSRIDERTTRATHVEVAAGAGPTLGVLGCRPAWGWGYEQGVNEAGLAVGNATIYTTLDPRPFPDALTGMDLVRLVLERCPTADDALSLVAVLLDTVGQGGSGHDGRRRPYWSSLVLADPQRAYVVETSGTDAAVEEVREVRAVSNCTTIAGFAGEVAHPRQPVEALVRPRLDASRSVLEQRPVTVDALQQHLRSHVGGADGWTVCMHVEEPGHEEATTASLVAELGRDRAPVAHVLVGHPCQREYQRIEVGPGLGADPVQLLG